MRILMFFVICITMAGCSQNSIRTASQDNTVEFNDTIKDLKEFAMQGDAEAQTLFGILFFEGKDVPQDYKQAVYWYQKAAEQGNAEAQARLG
ncbi:tetratricopeptide repeat protein, partial [Photobacterium angustum]